MKNELQKGLLNWYPFVEGTVALCIGKASELFTKELQSHNIQVFSETEASENSVDYIIVMDVLESSKDPVECLEKWRSYLKLEGHLFLAVENRMGLRFFAGDRDAFTERVFDGVEGYRNLSDVDLNYLKGRNYAQYELREMIEAAGLSPFFYSVLPGLEMPQQIYAEDYLPQEELEIRYTPLYHNPGTVFLEEGKLYDSIIKNGMFHRMANAYLIDCRIGEASSEIDFVTTSMDRGREKATATILYKDKTVEKKALYPEGNVAIETLLTNTQALANREISVVPMQSDEPGSCKMPYIEAETALTYLRRLIYEDKEKFVEEVDRFIQMILQSSEESKNKPADALGKYYENAYIDMVPLNCFYIDGKFVFYDQEYVEHDYPVNVVIVRAIDIIYMGDTSMEMLVPKAHLFARYNINEKSDALRGMGDLYIQKLRSRDALDEFNVAHRADTTVVNSNRLRLSYSEKEHQALFRDILPKNGEKVYIFGAGQWARKFIATYGGQCDIVGALDNSAHNRGREIAGVPILDPAILKELDSASYKVIICIKYYASIILQLRSYGVTSYSIFDPYYEDEAQFCAPVTFSPIEEDAAKKECDAEHQTEKKPYHIGYNAGVFDLFHIGHLNILRRAKEQCDYLIVGVVSDEQASKSKNKSPYINEKERLEIVKACRYVDEAFILPYGASGTRDVFKKYRFDAQFSGSDYAHDPYWLSEQKWLREHGADMVFFPYTQSTSSTKLKDAIEKPANAKDTE